MKALLIFFLFSLNLHAIIFCDDPENHVVKSPSFYDGVGTVKIYILDNETISAACGTASLINENWIITAKHLFAGEIIESYFDIRVDNKTYSYEISSLKFHPLKDLVLGKLNKKAKFKGYSLYNKDDEKNKTGIIVGYGISGKNKRCREVYPFGIKRLGYNKIHPFMDIILMYFDNKDSSDFLGMDKEALISYGDSGGPLFLDDSQLPTNKFVGLSGDTQRLK